MNENIISLRIKITMMCHHCFCPHLTISSSIVCILHCIIGTPNGEGTGCKQTYQAQDLIREDGVTHVLSCHLNTNLICDASTEDGGR